VAKKWKWRLAAVTVLAAAVWFAGAPLLRGLAGLLVVDEPCLDCGMVCVLPWGQQPDGDGAFAAAVELLRLHPSAGILVVEPPTERAVAVGVLDSFGTLAHRELSSRGVPSESIASVRCDRWSYESVARALAGTVRERPGVIFAVLCDRFRGAQLRAALDAALDPAAAARVRVRSIRDRRFDEMDWWTCRCGFRAFGFEWLARIQSRLWGDDAPPPPERNADAYERDFLRASEALSP